MGLPQGPSVRATSSEGGARDAGKSPGVISQPFQVTDVETAYSLCMCVSRACEPRVNPGAQANEAKSEAAFGVNGTVKSDVMPKRQCRPAPVTESRAWRIADLGVMESRAWRIAERDIPGGERNGERSGIADPALGVVGIVSSGVMPKRHRLPTEVEVAQSAPDELSSPLEALPQPTSVVSSSSSNADGLKAAFVTGFLAPTWATEPSIWLAIMDGTVTSEVMPKRHSRPAPVTESRAWRIADFGVMESRAWRIAERDIPGGERNGERSGIVEPVLGVAGIVSSGVMPKRHRLPMEIEVAQSAPDELSSPLEALLPQPTSVVFSSSCDVDSLKAALAAASLAPTWATEPSIWVEMIEVAIWK